MGVAILAGPLSGARAAACGAEVAYEGPAGGSWSTAGNWSTGKVPTEAQTACIPAGKGTVTVPSGPAATAKTLEALSSVLIVSGGTLKLAANGGFSEHSTLSDVTIEAGATLATVDARLFIVGNAVVNGEITGAGALGDEVVYEDAAGTFSGTGTIGPTFAGLAGTLAPGGVGTVGTLTFTHKLDSSSEAFVIAIDIASAVSFDEIVEKPGLEPSLSATVQPHLIGGYEPALHTKWRFLQSDHCVMCGTAAKPYEVVTAGEAGAASIELIEALSKPPLVPTVLTGAASPVTQTTATLAGTVNPNGSNVSVCEVQYGPSASYGQSAPCATLPGAGGSPVPVTASVAGLAPGTTYHYRVVATNTAGPGYGGDATFITLAVASPLPGTGGGSGGGSSTGEQPGSTAGVAATPAAIEALLLGCSRSPLQLNDVYIHGARVAIAGTASRSLVGRTVKILFDEGRTVATAVVAANGSYATTAPLPPARVREKLSTRYTAEIGATRSLHVKLTRRLLLETPRASGHTVTLSGVVTPPLTKPAAPVIVEQQLECGHTTVVKRFTPPASGRFHITLQVPAGARAAIYTLKSSVAANARATRHGFTTYSLPLPVALG